MVGHEPQESLTPTSTLPLSLTFLGLTPCPMNDDFRYQIPSCVLTLPGLKFLDVSGVHAVEGGH